MVCTVECGVTDGLYSEVTDGLYSAVTDGLYSGVWSDSLYVGVCGEVTDCDTTQLPGLWCAVCSDVTDCDTA